ncbi:DMT family transporter [Acetobacter orientalis]|uniref:DMT family transporter n=1 Tax=Acetobacter orientalis TaxID=146474 RepID=UPI0020A572CB|nr:DMT family transporter [Acetobacter orientalis]MCP1222387.1 DMT family transporter [Acetobacter orientalis]
MQTEKQAGTEHNLVLGTVCGIGAGALWGLVFLAPELVRAFTPLQLAVGRYLAYGALSAALIAPRWQRLLFTVKRQDWAALFWLSLFGNTLYYILLSMAVQAGGIALTSLVLGFLPVTVTLIGSRDKGAAPLGVLLPSLLCCAAGAVCIGWQAITTPGASNNAVTGLIYALAALISWTAYAVGNSRCLMRLPTVSIHDWNLLVGLVTGAQAVLLLPVVLLSGHLQYSTLQWGQFGAVSLAVAVIASLVGNALWNRMSRLVPLTMTGQMILFETLFALIYGFLWEERWPRPLEIAAFGLLVLSVLTCVSGHQKQATKRQKALSALPENGV